jgi:hypothetical protein
MKSLPVAIILLTMLACTSREEKMHSLPYPTPAPDTTALTFLKGVVSSDSVDFNAAFSPDGKSYYFTRSIKGQLTIYVTRYDSTWNTPVPVSFAEAGYSQADPAFGPDGKLYFISNRPKDASDTLADYDIWFVNPQGRDWSPIQNLSAVNSDSNEYYISVAHNSNLYFASSRAGGLGQEDIYVSAFNTNAREYCPYFAPGGDYFFFSSQGDVKWINIGAVRRYCILRDASVQ